MEVKIVSIYFLIFFINLLMSKIGRVIRILIRFLLFEPQNGVYPSRAGSASISGNLILPLKPHRPFSESEADSTRRARAPVSLRQVQGSAW